MKYIINGFGRIGRALLRWSIINGMNECVHINEPYANTSEMLYLLKYDSLYGKLELDNAQSAMGCIQFYYRDKEYTITTTHETSPSAFIDRIQSDFDVMIDASGRDPADCCYENDKYRVIFTLSSERIPNEIIFGLNEQSVQSARTNIYSASICDVVAIAPVLNALSVECFFENILITTLHPVLNYQNALDNYVSGNRAIVLGRQYNGSLIPKKTSAESVLHRVFPNLSNKIRCLSFRTPMESVCAADITICCENKITRNAIVEQLKRIDSRIIGFSEDELVSIDFKQSNYSAIVDMRWLEVVNQHVLKLLLWYDNEWGYVARVCSLISATGGEE